MTNEQIEALSGRDLDIAVAEQVMGWQRQNKSDYDWEPSANITEAWEVVTAMRAKGWFFSIHPVIELDESMIEFFGPDIESDGPVYVPYADEPAGICRAALLALEQERQEKRTTNSPA